jgi:hypothetical protein
LNKKTKTRNELESTLQTRVASAYSCPTCGQIFYGGMDKDSHRKRYPQHFEVVTPATSETVEEAGQENLKFTIKKRRQTK